MVDRRRLLYERHVVMPTILLSNEAETGTMKSSEFQQIRTSGVKALEVVVLSMS